MRTRSSTTATVARCGSATSAPIPATPGRNLPGQWVFSCLSHDIVVHEATHALVDRLRPLYKEATNIDVYAFHEGFADVVALFQHFALPELLARYIQSNRADLTARSPLVELAQQFGESTGRGRALRDALGEENPDPTRLGADPRTARPRIDLRLGGVRRLLHHLPGGHRRPDPDRHRRLRPAASRRVASRPGRPGGRRGAGDGAAGADDVHPGVPVPAAGRRDVRRLPPLGGDRRRRSVPRRHPRSARRAGRGLPQTGHLPRRGERPGRRGGRLAVGRGAGTATAGRGGGRGAPGRRDRARLSHPPVGRRGHRRAAGPAEGGGQGPQRVRAQARGRARTESPAQDPGAQLPRGVPAGRERSGQGQRGRPDHPDRPGRGVRRRATSAGSRSAAG